MSENQSFASLPELAGATFIVSDLARSVALYTTQLSYQKRRSDAVTAEEAARWQAPAAVGAACVELVPSGGGVGFIRLIEASDVAPLHPLSSYGWAALEIVVEDLDALNAQLLQSDFRVIGPPAVLDFEFTDQIRAMQVAGPDGEVLYLTDIGGEVPGFVLPKPVSFVGQPFVAVLASRAMSEAAQALAQPLGLPLGPEIAARVPVLAEAMALDSEYAFQLSTAVLKGGTLLEIDQYPDVASDRPQTASGFPAGMAMISLQCPPALIEQLGTRLLRVGPEGARVELLTG